MSVGFIEERGCRVLFMDFSGVQDRLATLARIEEARNFVAAQPRRKELLTLVDVSRMSFDNEILKAFRDLTVHDAPWERAVAVYGLRGVGLVAFRANNLITGGRLKGFKTREEAVDWLVTQ